MAASMQTIPLELLLEVASNLEPLWLINLSQTSKPLRAMLEFPRGNRVWYTALPSGTWKEAEQSRAPQRPLGLVSSPAASAIPVAVNHQHAVATLLPQPPNRRQPNVLLGGPYDIAINYKREIIGRYKIRNSCCICFERWEPTGRPLTIDFCGFKWCTACFKKYTISYHDLERITDIERYMSRSLTPKEMEYLKAPENIGRVVLFRPKVDAWLRSATGGNCNANMLRAAHERHERAKRGIYFDLREPSAQALRLRIVEVAEKLWEGYNPYSTAKLEDIKSGKIKEVANNSKTYERFRTRFAPTHSLRTFLFPAIALCDEPEIAPYEGEFRWLPDDTGMFSLEELLDGIDLEYVVQMAYNILNILTSWEEPKYNEPGHGGTVDTWIRAATKYHIANLEADLTTGATLRMDYFTPTMRQRYNNRGINKLRTDLGLTSGLTQPLTPLPLRPDRIVFTDEAYTHYIQQEKIVNEAEKTQTAAINAFNKILRAKCEICPFSDLHSFDKKRGFEGLVEHFRLYHAEMFWLFSVRCFG
ncbi:MAG: hypothetical protein M1812_004402 [Candelaria pacifica]|nr:MAG: hypothetical protein M1812_004402 [Candelaria pacifica]